MSVVKLDTGFNIELTLPITPFHKRVFAWGIDLMIQLAYIMVMNRLISDKYGWLAVIVGLPIFLYHLICEILMNGQSPGKKAMHIKVITAEGGQPSLSQYIIRWAFKVIDLPVFILAGIGAGSWPQWLVLFIFSGLACILITEKSQRIGDLIAGTLLIDTKNQLSWQDTVFMDVEENYVPVFPQVMRLSDQDINTIKQILVSSVRTKYSNREYTDRIAQKIQKVLEIETNLDSIEFMELLLKDYNYLTLK